MRFLIAIAVSVAFHGVLALALAFGFGCLSQPDVVAELDLSSVELSFAEKEDDAAALAPLPPAPPPQPPKPKTSEAPPPTPDRPLAAPPSADAPRFPEPVECPPEIPESVSQTPVVAEAPRQARVDAPPKPKRSIRPDYPRGARQRGEQGEVTLEIRVNAQGEVDEVLIVQSCGYEELDAAAVKAVRAAHFTPAKSGRKSVASTAQLKLAFKLK